MCDMNGDMIDEEWENISTKIVNCPQNNLKQEIQEIIEQQNIKLNEKAIIGIGYDSRSSSIPLSNAFIDGVPSFAQILNFELVTTPQLHFLISKYNLTGAASPSDYYKHFTGAYRSLSKYFKLKSKIVVDCANGVGSNQLELFSNELKDLIDIKLTNNGNGKLNYLCGADYVKMNQTAPSNVEKDIGNYASLDGDADRILCFYFDRSEFKLLDGDKIATLFAVFLTKLIKQCNLKAQIGVIQTAYANGSSTKYIQECLNIPVVFTSTGVKHLHHKAKEFDVGIYFEANGHGTVVFKDSFVDTVKEIKENENANILLAFINLVNQTVGDGISDLICITSILSILNLSFSEWNNVYQELPNKQIKVKVANRNAYKTTNADTFLVTPKGIQEKIDGFVAGVKQGRCFVRPSGTEDCVRIYVEAATLELCDRLGNDVMKLIE